MIGQAVGFAASGTTSHQSTHNCG